MAGSQWIGQDGNRWVADAQGTRNLGAATSTGQNYWANQGYTTIFDPVANGGNAANDAIYFDTGSNMIQGAGGRPVTQAQDGIEYVGGAGWLGASTTRAAAADPSYTDGTGKTWASRAAYDANANNVRRDVGVKQGGFDSEGRSQAAGNRLAYNNDSQDFVTGQRTGQNSINSGRVNNALNLRRSMSAIASGVRQGMRSGAVNLANMNAMDSGASEAMARALARQGNQQAGTVNNEAQIAENTFTTDQQNLGLQREQGLGRLKNWRDTKVNEISSKLWQNLSELDAQAQGQGVGGAVDMGIRDRVVSDASRQLDEVDALTQAELAKITGLDYNGVQARAAEMEAAGAAVSNPFTYEGGGLQVGNGNQSNQGGAPLGPLGTGPKRKDEQLVPSSWLRPEEQTVA